MGGRSWLPWWPKSWNPFSRRSLSAAYDYDAILASLTEEIDEVQHTLLDIKARKRRAVSSVLLAILSGWIAVLAILWGYTVVVHSTGDQEWEWYHSLYLVGLVLGTPVLLVVLHRLISLWFRRLEKAQETHLHALRRQRRTKINEIKKATDFEHLRSLLERYDDDRQTAEPSYTPADATQTSTDAAHDGRLRTKTSTRSLRGRPSREAMRHSWHPESLTSRDERPAQPAPPITGMPIMGVPSAPPPRGWMDKLADMVLGTDPYGASLEDQQYALICRNCFRHNGLVPKSEVHEIQYVCPHCGTFNSRRPSSKPVSSPFASQQPSERTHSLDQGGAPAPTEKPSRASLPADATKLPWQATSERAEAREAGSEEPVGQRRSARLRSQREAQERPEESMQLDE